MEGAVEAGERAAREVGPRITGISGGGHTKLDKQLKDEILAATPHHYTYHIPNIMTQKTPL